MGQLWPTIRAALVSLLVSAVLPGQTQPPQAPGPTAGAVIGSESRITPPPPPYSFPNGQALSYDVEWRLLTAGTATLRLDASGNEERVTATADSTGVFSVLYPVHDRFEAIFDPRTFCSTRITKHTEEGFRRLDTSIRFDYARHKSVLQEKNLKSGHSKQDENDIPGCVTDVVSSILYLSSRPLQVGQTYTFPLNDGGKTNDVRARVEAREEIKTPAGTFHTLRVQPEASSGVVRNKGRIWIWYSDDASHIPVQMRARLFWGTLTLRLARVEKK
ncbi:MAG TPA: DUF3108 domain-containing protein [Terriglobales bacterium]|nr:DUF3108 domain-containing protein [Terriglobales bacterium]